MIKDFPELDFIGGGEESFGFMVGDFVRDKDAVTSTLLSCEIAALLKKDGQTMYSKLQEIHLKHGLFKENLVSSSLFMWDPWRTAVEKNKASPYSTGTNDDLSIESISNCSQSWFLLRLSYSLMVDLWSTKYIAFVLKQSTSGIQITIS